MNDVHSCSFHCQSPDCARVQRDQLWGYVKQIYSAVNQIEPDNRWTFEQVIAYAIDKLKEKREEAQRHAE